ncbi:MAG: WD40/YVTN/BNR-like repeat-containing protein, partial [Gemmatimonadaceae bacterium]
MTQLHRRCLRALLGAVPFAAAALFPLAAPAQTNGRPFEADSLTLAGLRWRNIGPANFMGRVSDVAGIPSPSKTFFLAAAAGGIWKSTNNGVTWRPVFDNQRVISMGMLAIAPSDTQQVWAGTG